jgi:hypothetical protein
MCVFEMNKMHLENIAMLIYGFHASSNAFNTPIRILPL